MTDSVLIKQAKELLSSVDGKKCSSLQRQEDAIKLAGLLLDEAQHLQTSAEKKQQLMIAQMVKDPIGKVFTTVLTDQCFRSRRSARIANQLIYVISHFGIPSYLPYPKALALKLFLKVGQIFSSILVPLTFRMVQQETRHVILPGEDRPLIQHIKERQKEGVRINLNHLGEAILGEEEAQTRLNIYIKDLERPEIEYISVKISTIYSQINLLSWKETLATLASRLRQLYRVAMANEFVKPNGDKTQKFVNLDMEEYRDLRLTVALFCQVLDEPEFYALNAGIVLQSYLPDSFEIQKELTKWAARRCERGGAPIKIRLVKGANLAMEQVEAALKVWPQAPYTCKADVDTNYKRMMVYGCNSENACVAHIGIASHNLFDIAYALLLRSENQTHKEISFEMLEGMADHMRRAVQCLTQTILLYCPAASKHEFQNAVAYLVRRLDENTASENFLRQAFDLQTGTVEWNQQAALFSASCTQADNLETFPRRTQDRTKITDVSSLSDAFQNEADTDWTLPQNQLWAHQILEKWKNQPPFSIPFVIGGESVDISPKSGIGCDPSVPNKILYSYTNASIEHVHLAIKKAKEAEKLWSYTTVESRCHLLLQIANELRNQRADLIGAMVADTGKTVSESDIEISEAIDFAEYYARNYHEWNLLTDVSWQPKGTILVATPWNFPCSIPIGGIVSALVTGNCVIFKPANEAVLVGWLLAQLCWKAGISQNVLQFITCEDEPVGSELIQDPRISAIILTGATSTAQHFLKMRPGLDLMAETGGKNTLIISGLSDRDLAIKDVLQSAFGHAGQKCSACSLAILDAEVYDDPHFLKQLKDAALSLAVGSAWNFKTKVNPLISLPSSQLMRGFTQLDEGEQWLVEPQVDSENPQLWSTGIKLGVKPESFTFQNELFGPVLGLVRAQNIEHAFQLMNETPYGLTAGIHSLDEREQIEWLKQIEVGNCYINRTITGAIVERQPFGGCKASSFGRGLKAGGPNYLTQLMTATQFSSPNECAEPNQWVNALNHSLKAHHLIEKEHEMWVASIENYAFYWREFFSHRFDPMNVLGQDNLQCYTPHKNLLFRLQADDSALDYLRVIAAALTCQTPLIIYVETQGQFELLSQLDLSDLIQIQQMSDEQWIEEINAHHPMRIRLLSTPSKKVQNALAENGSVALAHPVLANGRIELLHYLREISVSHDYHRYGNLGIRENERRAPLVNSTHEQTIKNGNKCNSND